MALYTSAMLEAAVSLARSPIDREFSHRAETRSRSCGSSLVLAFDTDGRARIAAIGVRPQACAVGQAAAAAFVAGAVGKSAAEVRAGRDALRAWLAGDTDLPPDWPMIAVIAPARAHRGRHDAILLAWEAALSAFATADGGGG